MATSLSAKALSNLVCESSVRTSEVVLNQELERNLVDIVSGVLAHTNGIKEAGSESGTTSKKKTGKLATFLKELAQFLGVTEGRSKPILTSYLAGTSEAE